MKTVTFVSTLIFLTQFLAQAQTKFHQALPDANVKLRGFGTSSGFQQGTTIFSQASWDLKINDNGSITYSDLQILNRLSFNSENTYYTSIFLNPVTIRESLTLNINITHPEIEWTVPLSPGTSGLTVPGMANYYGQVTSTVNIYGNYTFAGPTETVTNTFSFTVAFTGYQQYFDGGKLILVDAIPQFTEFYFHGDLENFYLSSISPLVNETVDGVSVYYGSPGIQDVYNGDLLVNLAPKLITNPVPEPQLIPLLIFGLLLLFAVSHFGRPRNSGSNKIAQKDAAANP